MTPARNFGEGAAQRINKHNGVGNYLHGRWIIPFFVIIFWRTLSSGVFERRASTESGVFVYLSRDLEQILGQIVSLRVKTLSNTNLLLPRHIKNKKAYFWLTSVAQKHRCLNSLLTFECEDCEWDSDYDNHRNEIVIVFDWYNEHWGVILNKNERKYNDIHPWRFDKQV